MDDSTGVSPPAPALPPRRYRGEVDLTMVDRLPPSGAASSSRSMDATNGESTLPQDTYANQLRRQARRYQHSRGSSFSHPRPPVPDWKPPLPPVLPPEPPPQPTSDDPAGRSFESGLRKLHSADAPSSSRIEDSEVPKSWSALSSSSNNYTTSLEPEKSSARTSLPDIETPGIAASELKPTEVQEDVNRSRRSSFFDPNSGGDRELGSSSSATYQHPEVDVVSGYDRYYSSGDHTTSLSRSFSSFIPSDSQSTEIPSVRRSSHSSVSLNVQPTKTSPRNAVGTSAMERSASSASFTNNENSLSVDQKALSISDVEFPVGKSQLNIEVELQEATVSSEDPEVSSNIEEGKQSPTVDLPEPSLTELKFFQRLRFPAEADCARQAEIVAGLLRRMDRDDALVNALLSSTGHRTATDFMAKVLGMAESEQRCYDDFPETLRLRLSARDIRHAALYVILRFSF